MYTNITYDDRNDIIIFTNEDAHIFRVVVHGMHYAITSGEWAPFVLFKQVKAKNKFQAITLLEHYLKLQGYKFCNVTYTCEDIKKRT